MRASVVPQSQGLDLGIPGVTVHGELGRGAHSVVFLATYEQRQVALKSCRKADLFDEAAAIRFRREAAALARLSHPSLAQVLCVGEDDSGRPYVMLEHVAGETLAMRLSRGSLNESETISIALPLAEALAEVHRRALVHRDVKPANVMLDAQGRPKLIDFGLATNEDPTSGVREVVGTFAYSAPEQTGMMRRGLDGRADLYALGVTMFECLTGQMPFEAEEPGRLIQMHAIEPAPKVRSLVPAVSATLEAVIDKLLAKDPDDRYPSASALCADLRIIDRLSADPSALGRRGQAALPTQDGLLIGRREELAQLSQLAVRARAGHGALVWIESEKGYGASQLVRKWLDGETARNPLRLWATCSERQAPLDPLRRALARLARETPREELSSLLKAATGEYASVLAAELPQLAPLLDAPKLDAESLNADLGFESLCALLLGLAMERSMVVLAVDDAELMDTAFKSLLERLSPRVAQHRILIVCTAQPGHDAKAIADQASLTIQLGPLDEIGVAGLCADFLGSKHVDPNLTAQVFARSAGAPRAVHELLCAFLDQGLLTARFGHWQLDAERLRRLAMPESVEKLALLRLGQLSRSAREILRVAALLGRDVDEALVCDVGELAADDVRAALHEAAMLHVLERMTDELGEARFVFLHDQVRAALGEEISADRKNALHVKTALRLEKSASDGDPGAVFETARQWQSCVSQEHAARAYAAMARAGELALVQHAFVEAAVWLERAGGVERTFRLQEDHRVQTSLAEAYAHSGRMVDAIAAFEEAARRCRDGADQARIHLRLAEMFLWSALDAVRMQKHLDLAFRALGQRIPMYGALKALGLGLVYLVLTLLAEKTGWGFGRKANDRKFRAQYKLLEQAGAYAFISNRFAVLFYLFGRNMWVSHAIGPSRELAWARAARAHTLSAFGASWQKVERIVHKAYQMADQLSDITARARVAQLHSSAMFFAGNLAEAEKAAFDCLTRYGRVLDVGDLVMCTLELSISLVNRGHNARAKACAAHCERVVHERSYQDDSRTEALDMLTASLSMLDGNFGAMSQVKQLREKFPIDRKQNHLRWFSFHNLQVGVCFETDEVSNVDALLDEINDSGLSPMTASWHHVPYWYQRVMVRQRQYLTCTKAEASLRKTQLDEAVKALKVCARRPCDQWMLLHAQGARLSVRGEYDKAFDVLLAAEKSAQLWDAPRGVFFARVERAAVLQALGHVESAQREFSDALAFGEQMGWPVAVRGIKRLYRLTDGVTNTRTAQTHKSTTLAASSTATGTAFADPLRRDRDALLAVSLAASETIDPLMQAHAVLERVLAILGGERAFVFLRSEGSDALSLYAARDALGNRLGEDAQLARSLVQRVASTQKPLVLSGTDAGVALGSESVVTYNLRSMICAPLLLREKLLGVIYLDSRLAAGVFNEQDLSILVGLANHIAVARAAALSMQYEIERKANEKDAELSAAVQGLLLPQRSEVSHGQFSLAAYFRPAAQVAGDWWFYDILDDGRLRIVLGDVTGHGAAAAMVSAVVSGWYRRTSPELRGDTQRVLADLHEGMRELCRGTFLMPMAAIELDPHSSELSFWSAGAPPLLIQRHSGESEVLQARGAPLGGDTLLTPRVTTLLHPGDFAMLASDGLYELSTSTGRPLGVRRVRSMFRECALSDTSVARDALVERIQGLSGDVLADDLTMVVIGRSLIQG